jgi:hypothetical protein
MLKSKGKTCMVEEPSHVKQLSLIHVCKIGLTTWKVAKTTAHQKLIFKVKKPVEALIYTQNYPFLSKYLNSIL